jgi:hypothetical protein
MRFVFLVVLAACAGSTPPPAEPESRCAQDEHIVPAPGARGPEPAAIAFAGSEEEGFALASKAFDLGEYAEATGRFKGLYEKNPRPQFLYNIGRSLHLMNDCRAQQYYELYLASTPPERQRLQVERHLEALRERCLREPAWSPPPARSC